MTKIDEIAAAVEAESKVEQSVITLLTKIHADLQAALAAGDTPQMQTIIDKLKANTDALAAAVAANTDATAPVEPPAA